MIPTSFDESNGYLDRPPDMTDDECGPLSVFRDSQYVISCWKLTVEELETLTRTGRVWLWIVGQSMPPVSLTVDSPFTKKTE